MAKATGLMHTELKWRQHCLSRDDQGSHVQWQVYDELRWWRQRTLSDCVAGGVGMPLTHLFEMVAMTSSQR